MNATNDLLTAEERSLQAMAEREDDLVTLSILSTIQRLRAERRWIPVEAADAASKGIDCDDPDGSEQCHRNLVAWLRSRAAKLESEASQEPTPPK